jgi:hypothetical protein
MRSMNDYHWAQDKIDEVCNGDKKHREEKACERRLKQMAARREKEAARRARKVGATETEPPHNAELNGARRASDLSAELGAGD